MSDSPLAPKAKAYFEIHAAAESVRRKQAAGEMISEEEEAILEREGALAAELRQDSERQERCRSRAEAVARSLTLTSLLGACIIAGGLIFLGRSVERAVNNKGGSVDRLGNSIERAAANFRPLPL